MNATFKFSDVIDSARHVHLESAVEIHDGHGIEGPDAFGAASAEPFPQRRFAPRPAKPVPTPEQLSAWLSRLDFRGGDSARQALWKMIHGLNRAAMSGASQRLALLEILRPAVVKALGQEALAVPMGTGFPLASTQYLSALCAIRLATTFGQAYWLVINSPEFSREESLSGIHGAVIMRRALEIHGLSMLRSFETYAPLTGGFWRRVYGMYIRAELRGWLEVDCGPAEEGGHHSTIHGAFKHICLFAVANPHQYRPDEIRAAFRFLAPYASLAELLPAKSGHPRATPFVVDLFGDAAPLASELRAEDEAYHSGVRFLRTLPLIVATLGQGSELMAREIREPLVRAKLRTLIKTLGAPLARHSRRFEADSAVGLVLGLAHIQDALTEVDEKEFVEYRGVRWLRIPNFALQEVESIELVDRVCLADYARSGSAHSQLPSRFAGEISRDGIWQIEGISESSGLTATMLDSSATGYGLRVAGTRSACLKVGSLVGLRTPAGTLHVGTVRWLRYDEAGQLRFGMELLMPAAVPVRVVVPGENRRAVTPALFYPGNSSLAADARLVVVPGAVKPNQVAVLESLSGQPAFRVERLVESSPDFQQFAVSPLAG